VLRGASNLLSACFEISMRIEFMSRWAVSLLGDASLVRTGNGVVVVPTTCWPVFGFLLTCPAHRALRSKIAGTLWPEQSEEAARHCLATTLWRFNCALTKRKSPILSLGDILTLDKSIWVDAFVFQKRMQQIEGNGTPASFIMKRQRLRSAIRLYRGDFLHSYDADWLFPERERLRSLYLDALFSLTCIEAKTNEWESVVAVARVLCALEPLREDAHRMLMEGYARTGNRALAIKQFRICVEALHRELGVEPMIETIDLERSLSGRKMSPNIGNALETIRLRGVLTSTRAALRQMLDVVDNALNHEHGSRKSGDP
jgi:DNA-binding SARP family transcriptional activator